MFSPKVAKDLSVWPLFGVTFVVITVGAAKGTIVPTYYRLPLAASSASVTNSIIIPIIASGGNIKNSKPI